MRTSQLELAAREGGYLLACSHVSNLDPFCLSVVIKRKIHWMARLEFYRKPWISKLMHALDTFPVNRQGTPVRAIKTAIKHIEEGRVVGIFPEGELRQGMESVMRGGAIKRGVCLIAQRTGKPVIPCIILGTEQLLKVKPWLPCWRGKLWVICGPAIESPKGMHRKEARLLMATELEAAFKSLYSEMQVTFAIDDSVLP